APLFYVSSGQINFQLPFEVLTGVKQLVVTVGNQQSAPIQVAVAGFSAGIFQYGQGRGVIQNQNYSLNGPDNPAAGGSSIIVYFTGIGKPDHAVADGAVAPSDPLARFAGTATATIGDVNAPVEFAGLTPGAVGLAQANIQVPVMPAGSYPLQISLNGYQGVSA